MSKGCLVNSIFLFVNLKFCPVEQKPGDQEGAASKIMYTWEIRINL